MIRQRVADLEHIEVELRGQVVELGLDRVGVQDADILAEREQHARKRGLRSDAIAIRPHVAGQQKALARPYEREHALLSGIGGSLSIGGHQWRAARGGLGTGRVGTPVSKER